MKKTIQTIVPFLSSISYLTLESQQLGLREVFDICQAAEQQLSKHIIDELFSPNLGENMISEHDYQHISKVLNNANALSATELVNFIQHLKQYYETEDINSLPIIEVL